MGWPGRQAGRLVKLGGVAVEKSETLSKAPFLYRGLTVIVTDI